MTQGKRFPIQQQVGRPGPGPDTAAGNPLVAQMLGAMMQGPAGPALNPDAFQGAPPWVPMLLNQIQAVETKQAAFQLAIMRRGLLTQAELNEAMMEMSRVMEEEFVKAVQGIGQRMPPAAPQDPRRPPMP